jgi:hypothetical protein
LHLSRHFCCSDAGNAVRTKLALERQREEGVKVAEARAQAELMTKAAEEQAAQTRLLAEEQVHDYHNFMTPIVVFTVVNSPSVTPIIIAIITIITVTDHRSP